VLLACGDTAARLQRNLRMAVSEAGSGLFWAEILEWGEAGASPLMLRKWDVVLGSDLCYSEAGILDLCACLAELILSQGHQQESSTPVVLYAHTCGRWGGALDAALYWGLHEMGLTAVPVGGDPKTGSDELCQHVVVFQIQQGQVMKRVSDQVADGESGHVLMRARQLQTVADVAADAAMTPEERDAVMAARWYEEFAID